jgi:hypothetical protein
MRRLVVTALAAMLTVLGLAGCTGPAGGGPAQGGPSSPATTDGSGGGSGY